MTINDMLYDSITIQGKLIVTRFDESTSKDVVLYNGDAEFVGDEYDDDSDDSWLDESINFIYPDMHEPNTLYIELCF